MPSALQLQQFLAQLGRGDRARLETRSWVIERFRDAVFCHHPGPLSPPEAVPIVPGERLQIAGVGTVVLQRRDGGDGGAAPGSFSVRFRTGGERLLQGDGSHLRLKTLFQSLAVPRWWRGRVPLLFCDETLLWVGPYRASADPAAASLEFAWEPELLGD
jgi:tRNA(Ile)-lysidine synthase